MPLTPALADLTGIDPGDDNGAEGPHIENPLGERNDARALIIYVVEEVTLLGLYVSAFFWIYTGFLFVKSVGNKTKIEEARNAFLYTLIGSILLLGGNLFARVIDNTVKDIQVMHYPQEIDIV